MFSHRPAYHLMQRIYSRDNRKPVLRAPVKQISPPVFFHFFPAASGFAWHSIA